MFLTEKYLECLVEYRPIMVNGFSQGIEVVNDRGVSRTLDEIERRVDKERARRQGCKTDIHICAFLNGEMEWGKWK